MVRLKVYGFVMYFGWRHNFNSTMVRLKADQQIKNAVQQGYFNSTMVRLKEASYGQGNSNAPFQFHYGTIKSILVVIIRMSILNFNSTMVRLKGFAPLHLQSGYKISIPLWYD